MRTERRKIKDFLTVCRYRGIDIDDITEVLETPGKEKQPLEKETVSRDRPIVLIAITLSFLSLIIEIVALLIGR